MPEQRGGDVWLVLEDAFGGPVKSSVVMSLKGPVSGEYGVTVNRDLRIQGLPIGDYACDLAAAGYRIASTHLHVRERGIGTKILMKVDTSSSSRIVAPHFEDLDVPLRALMTSSSRHEPVGDGAVRMLGGASLYRSLDDEARARLLNIYAKTSSAPLLDDGSLFDLFDRIDLMDGDEVVFRSRRFLFSSALRNGAFPGVSPDSLSLRTGGERTALMVERGATGLAIDIVPSRDREAPHLAVSLGRELAASERNPVTIGERLVQYDGIKPGYNVIVQPRPERRPAITGARLHGIVEIETGATRTRAVTRTRSIPSTEPAPAADLVKAKDAASLRDAAAPLTANQWIELPEGGEQPPDKVAFVEGAEYLFWFEAAYDARASAHSETVEPPAEWASLPRALVEIEVRSNGLRGGPIESRRVSYEQGIGIRPQAFQLLPAAPTLSLVVQLRWQGRTVYSKGWSLDVAAAQRAVDSPAAAPIPPVPPRTPSPPATPPERGNAESEGREYRLIVDTDTHTLALAAPNGTYHETLSLNAFDFLIYAPPARRELSEFAALHKRGADGQVDPSDGLDFLQKMARWGRKAFEMVFRPDDLHVGNALAGLAAPDWLLIDAQPASFPWDWIYTGERRLIERAPTDLDAFLNGFLGYRLATTVLPTIGHNQLGASPVLANSARTSILAAVNPTTDPVGGPRNKRFVEQLKDNGAGLEASLCFCKHDTIDGLKLMNDGQVPHLLYFYGHHRSGAGLNEHGFIGFGSSTLFMKDRDNEPLTRDELDWPVELKPFRKNAAPLVVLNACGTAQGAEFLPSGFVPYFTTMLGAPAAVGTLAEIPAVAAHDFCCAFVQRWLNGGRLDASVHQIRRAWLRNANPFGMYYTVHGDGALRLAASVPLKEPTA